MRTRGSNLLRDVYRDLRDRRLLFIAIALVAAIVAVPFLIRSDEDPDGAASPSTPAAALDDAEIVDPVVLAEAPELRDFRRRLNMFRSRNPFQPQLTRPVGGTLEDTAATGGGELAESTGGTDVTTLPDGSGDVAVEEGSIASPSDSTTTEPEEPADPVDSVQPSVEEPEPTLYSTRIDVRVGPVGDTNVLKDVRELAYLPDDQHPVVEYISGDFDLTRAVFVVSPAVVSSDGDGKCEPSLQACQFLLLKVDEEQSFEYEDGQVYRLKLVDVTLHEQPFDGNVDPDDPERGSGFSVGRSVAGLTG